MKLTQLRIQNYRSIKDSDEIRIEPLQAFVGENNAGKSNILMALNIFLTAGSGGVEESDYFDPSQPIFITATFGELHPFERKPPLRKYLLGDKLILEKRITLVPDKKNSSKHKPEAEYHGYIATPKDWWLSIEGITKEKGEKFRLWKELAEEKNLTQYVKDENGNINKKSFDAGLQKYLEDHPETEYNEPKLGETQALGIQPHLLDALPSFHLLPAITDYSDEIDKRTTSSNFRKLMADLSERIIQTDSRYQDITTTLNKLSKLFNAPREGETRKEDEARLEILGVIENKIRELIARLMPTVAKVRLDVIIDEMKEVFSRGVSVWIDDGKDTEVLHKGHGMQRCVVFAFLQALVLNQRGNLVPEHEKEQKGSQDKPPKTIILAIEEPELYIHPQLQRVIYGVLNEFAQMDQVLCSTHEPSFVDVSTYHQIAVVRKPSYSIGTKVTQCEQGVLGGPEDRKGFQFLNSFNVEKNQMFFARKNILVEGEEDLIAILAIGRSVGLFKEFPEEKGYSIVVTDNKDEMPKFMKVLNAFKIPYVILHELDGEPNSDKNKKVRNLLNENQSVELSNCLEDAVGHKGHFGNVYFAKVFFKDVSKIPREFNDKVKELFAS